MNSDSLTYQLIRGIDIPYMNVKIKQPTIKDIDRIGLLNYSSMSYIFRMQKEHLQLYDEIGEQLQEKTMFESLVIQEEILTNRKLLQKKEEVNMSDSMIILLGQSLCFFLGITDFNRIRVNENYTITIYDFKDINGQVFETPIFTLDNSNFDEFSELIRIICHVDILEVKKDKSKQKVRKYKDRAIQQKYEMLMKQWNKKEEEKKKENGLTISDVIGAICINEKTKYNYKNIEELTIWQLFYEFTGMFTKENIEIVKAQFTSGNYNFEKVPDMDWLKKVKVKLPENIKIIEQ